MDPNVPCMRRYVMETIEQQSPVFRRQPSIMGVPHRVVRVQQDVGSGKFTVVVRPVHPPPTSIGSADYCAATTLLALRKSPKPWPQETAGVH